MDPIYSRLRVRDIPPVPQEVLDAFETGSATLIPIDEKSRALTDLPLRMENGISEFDDGSMMVAVSCHLAGVTREMLEWWEWWSPGHVDAFRAWLPDSNYDLTYSEEYADYFNAESMPEFHSSRALGAETVRSVDCRPLALVTWPVSWAVSYNRSIWPLQMLALADEGRDVADFPLSLTDWLTFTDFVPLNPERWDGALTGNALSTTAHALLLRGRIHENS